MSNKGLYKQKVIIGIVFYNEAEKLERVLKKTKRLKFNFPHKFAFVDDGSTDNSSKTITDYKKRYKLSNHHLIRIPKNRGVGNAIRETIKYGRRNNFDICVIMAGNGKDDPAQIPLLIKPITENDYDYIQGSRFLQGGSFKNLPLYRKIFIKVFTLTFALFTGFNGTDSSNGFRAYKLSIFNDKNININQRWLDRYELETYLHYKVLTGGYKVKEVAVKKDYIKRVKSYTKMRPLLDWWKMARPLLLLRLGLRK